MFLFYKNLQWSIILKKKKSLAQQRHRPEFLARNEAFLVRFLSLQSIARATFLHATCRKGNKRGTITRRRLPKRRNDKGAAAAARRERWNYRTQRLSSQVEGKCQKYSRIGPLTLVPLDQEPSLEKIKKACQLHFNTDLGCVPFGESKNGF